MGSILGVMAAKSVYSKSVIILENGPIAEATPMFE